MKSLNLLIIDDDDDQREITREVLEERFGKGCVDQAVNGAQALAKDLSCYDMILSDFNLPDCTGLELLTQIRSRCRTPVIMVTGENVAEFAAEAIRRGATDYVVKVGDYFFTIPLVVEKNLTVAKLTQENEDLQGRLQSALTEVQNKNQALAESLRKVEELAATDALTGLYNRRHFSRVVDQLYAESRRYGSELSIVMIDLDGYKQLNDTHGHQVGDQILVIVGQILRQTIRKADVAARYGGDEFVLLLPHADAAEAGRLIARVREQYLASSADLLKKEKGMTMSIGIAAAQYNQAATADELVHLADEALYVSKQAGRDRVTISQNRKARIAS